MTMIVTKSLLKSHLYKSKDLKMPTRHIVFTMINAIIFVMLIYIPHNAEADSLDQTQKDHILTGEYSKLPVPRFASLRSDVSNMRTGPGSRYPIDWIYKRSSLPVKIVREFSNYYLVVDPYGTQGWMNQAVISSRRTFIIIGRRTFLRDIASHSGNQIADLRKGAIGNIIDCDRNSSWCNVRINSYSGWVQKIMMWGVGEDDLVK